MHSLLALAACEEAVGVADLVGAQVVHGDANEAALGALPWLEQLKVLVDGDGLQNVAHIDAAGGDYGGATLAGGLGAAEEDAQLAGTVEVLAAGGGSGGKVG